MKSFVPTTKYEIVVGLINEVDGYTACNIVQQAWQTIAKEFYEMTGIYVSAIANFGHAVYHRDWGCPLRGEETVTFNCTANRVFIEDMEKYEEGVFYITKKLKKQFHQHTITITKISSEVCYLTDEDNEDEE